MVFEEYAEVYDCLNNEKDYVKETEEIENLILKYTNKKDMLALGCGTGKHDREFAKKGYAVSGIDMSEAMIAIANKEAEKHGLCINYSIGDIREFTAKKHTIILALFHVISYLNTYQDLEKAFRNVKQNIKEDGIYIFDAWYGPGVLHDLPSVRVKRVQNQSSDIIRIAEPVIYLDKNTVDVNYEILVRNKVTKEIQTVKEKHSMRYWFQEEITTVLEKAGLQLVECLECKSLGEPTIDSWTTYFIVKNNNSVV